LDRRLLKGVYTNNQIELENFPLINSDEEAFKKQFDKSDIVDLH